LLEISVGFAQKIRNKDAYETRWTKAHIPLLYVQLIAQLVAEDKHGNEDDGHESLRRQSYAREVLDAVGREIRRYRGEGIRFRSAVLNPILQRYRQGVPDGYTPAVCDAISADGRPTITEATIFYLEEDPLSLLFVSSYRRNLIYIPESRWFLRVLLQKANLLSKTSYNFVRANHVKIVAALAKEDDTVTEDGEDSHFTEVEIKAILQEGLDEFFKHELSWTVCVLSLLRMFHL